LDLIWGEGFEREGLGERGGHGRVRERELGERERESASRGRAGNRIPVAPSLFSPSPQPPPWPGAPGLAPPAPLFPLPCFGREEGEDR